MSTIRAPRESDARTAGRGESGPAPSLLLRWTRVGAASGFLAALSYALGSAGLSAALDLVAACVLGPALMGFSMGLTTSFARIAEPSAWTWDSWPTSPLVSP